MAVIQSKEFTGTFPITSGAVAFDSSVTAGSTIVACVTFYQPGTRTCTATDNVNAGGYSQGTIRSTGNYNTKILYKENVSAGSTTVTVDVEDGSDLWFSITEISCPDATSFDAEGGATGSSAAPSCTVTTTGSNTILFGVFVHDNGTDPALGVGSGFTIIHEQEGGSAVMPGLSEYKAVSASGSQTVDGTIGTSAGWGIAAAAFEQAGGGGGGGGGGAVSVNLRGASRLRPRPFAPGLAR